MILEVKQWPVSQDLMENPEWFFIDDCIGHVGDSAYARDITIGYKFNKQRFERLQESESYLVGLLNKRQLEQYIKWLDNNESK